MRIPHGIPFGIARSLWKNAMVDFADRLSMIAVVLKMLWQCYDIRHVASEMDMVARHTDCIGPEARHQTRP